MPDWQPIVDTYLARFATVTSADVDRTEHWATNASMFDATGTWRAKVVRGELFVKFIRAHSHWAERTSVLRIVMLALDGLRREGVSLPDFEFVYAHNDKDPTPDSFPKCPRHLPRRNPNLVLSRTRTCLLQTGPSHPLKPFSVLTPLLPVWTRNPSTTLVWRPPSPPPRPHPIPFLI